MISKIAVISDIHSNIQALETVMSSIEEEGIEIVYCLGDVVGYGANPNETVKAIGKLAEGRTVIGNHDKAVANSDMHYLESFNPDAKLAIEYQKRIISKKNQAWLNKLPEAIRNEDILFCHGSPLGTEHYILTEGDLWLVVQALQDDPPWIVFFGHTHIPLAVSINSRGSFSEFDLKFRGKRNKCDFELKKDERYFINPGSVGQPRDNLTSASYVILDRESQTICFKRVKYDVAEAKRRIVNANLPNALAKRLGYGM